jgi:hypothetical protein
VNNGTEARTPDFDSRTIYGEDLPTDFYQRLQVCHHIAKQTAFKNTDKNIDKYTEGHDKILKTRTFTEGERVLLKFKDFKLKNRKLCEEWKGPFIITKSSPTKRLFLKLNLGNMKHCITL